MTSSVHWDFLFKLILSIRFNSVILFYIKFGTKHATGNMVIFMMLHTINPLDISNQAK